MKKFFVTTLLAIMVLQLRAFHIVGGEIEFVYLRDGLYRITLVQYFDEAQRFNPGPEAAIEITIFRNSDNALISSHTLTLLSQEDVEYTNIKCAIPELQTSKIIWTADVSLYPAAYSDPKGYYITWERCCRNSDIANIVNPKGSGIKYILEIPPLMKKGRIFKNSSPGMFQPLRDYACVGQFYSVAFTGVDPDGDSLVYSLANPLNTASQIAVPIPTPKPNIDILFNPGFSADNQIPGAPALAISYQGRLTIKPTVTGLFVFAVKIEEYRDKVKIGESRRDFQMLVVDGCNPPDPPQVAVDIPGNPGFDPKTDILTYTVAESKCFDLLVSNIAEGETIVLKVEGVNFDKDLRDIFSLNQILVGTSTPQLRVEVCVPDCPPVRDDPFILDLIAGDDACPLPQFDTLRLSIKVEPPPNVFPDVTSAIINPLIRSENTVYSASVDATDSDGDDISIGLYIEGIDDPSRHGFDINVTGQAPGILASTFSWDTNCPAADFSRHNEFRVGIVVDDDDICKVPNPDTVWVDSRIILPPNTDPVVSSSISLPPTMDVDVDATLSFGLTVSDVDGDHVSLIFSAGDFDPAQYGILFTAVSGDARASTHFSWTLDCNSNLYRDGQEFELFFIGDDAGGCKVTNFDTLCTTIKVRIPENSVPQFEAVQRYQTVNVNDNIEIPIEAFDLDNQDKLTLSFAEGIRQPASESLFFQPATGTGRVMSVLQWQPECSLFRTGQSSLFHDMVFQVSDDACPANHVDTLKITFEVIDNVERQTVFNPPNIFTPNNDGLNDTFQLSGNVDFAMNLPPNNCDNTFEFITINNRAGSSVFKSESKDFSWSGGQFPSGIYYYFVKYTATEYKGYVHLIR